MLGILNVSIAQLQSPPEPNQRDQAETASGTTSGSSDVCTKCVFTLNVNSLNIPEVITAIQLFCRPCSGADAFNGIFLVSESLEQGPVNQTGIRWTEARGETPAETHQRSSRKNHRCRLQPARGLVTKARQPSCCAHPNLSGHQGCRHELFDRRS